MSTPVKKEELYVIVLGGFVSCYRLVIILELVVVSCFLQFQILPN